MESVAEYLVNICSNRIGQVTKFGVTDNISIQLPVFALDENVRKEFHSKLGDKYREFKVSVIDSVFAGLPITINLVLRKK